MYSNIQIEAKKVNCVLMKWELGDMILPGTNNSKGICVLINIKFQPNIHNYLTERRKLCNYNIYDYNLKKADNFSHSALTEP